MFVLVPSELERGLWIEWRVECHEDGAVCVHGEVLQVVHPVWSCAHATSMVVCPGCGVDLHVLEGIAVKG